MNVNFWTALINQLPTLIVAIATLITAIKTSTHIQKVHQQINSRMDELLKITATSARAEGVKQESERLK